MPAQCLEVQTVVKALVDRLDTVSWEAVEGRELVPVFFRRLGLQGDATGLVSSHVSEENMGHKALMTQSRECCASVALGPGPESDHPRLMAGAKVMVLESNFKLL